MQTFIMLPRRVRTFGHAHVEVWPATQWERFKRTARAGAIEMLNSQRPPSTATPAEGHGLLSQFHFSNERDQSIQGRNIEVQVERVSQLFHTLDPFPFRERDLDKEAEEFIVGWARELPQTQPLKIIVHLPKEEASTENARELGNAMRQYFQYRAQEMTGELRELFRIGRWSLAIGLSALAISVFLSRLVFTYVGRDDFGRYLNEGILILGWVANWRPMEIFLYEWWPITRRRRLYRRLAVAQVELAPR